MDIKVILSEQYGVSNWSGGKTTQMVIWPENASYSARDFLFRISSATVDAEESDFTILPDTARIIMVLEGELRLFHKGENTKLAKYEAFCFDGGRPTKSYGKATDFNLMLRNCKGEMAAIEIEEKPQEIKCKADFTCIYLARGSADIAVGEKSYALPQNAMLFVQGKGNIKLCKTNQQNTKQAVRGQGNSAKQLELAVHELICDESETLSFEPKPAESSEKLHAIIAQIWL